MFRLFARHLSKQAAHDVTQPTTREQFERLRQNPKFFDIIEEMRHVSEQVREHGHGKKISAEEISKLLDLEKESAKYSIY